jgi:LuxR family transcriptional regulator, maltose regulon positive regulatory protein
MPTPFLSTKFFIPHPRKIFLRREHLFDLLNEGIQGKLILASAPAGYGKTTLVTTWLKEQEFPVAWVSADAGDNDFYRFFGYILEAFRQKNLQVGETLSQMLQSPAPPGQDNFVELFLNELSTISQACILVIDDFHLITNPAIHASFYKVIESSPEDIHFILCSRTELPFSVSRLRAGGDLLEITQRELSLTLEESTLYMNTVMGAGMQPVDVAVLRDRTEGWVVGMQLAALSLRDMPDPVGFIHSLKGDNRYIADYLVDEVLLLMPEDLQDFLLRTSVLNRLEASLCNYVLQINNSQELLESLDKRRLFIFPLDDYRHWFRYHNLFGEMLFDRLFHKRPEIMGELYHRSSEWHAEHEMKEEAVDYALKGKDPRQAADLIKEIGLPILYHGDWDQLLSWFDQIPENEFQRLPDLWIIYFLSLINKGLIAQAAKKLEGISVSQYEALDHSKEEINRLRGELAAVQGVIYLHYKVDPWKAKESLKVAQEFLSNEESFRSAFINNNYGVSCLLLGEVEEAKKTYEKSIARVKANGLSLSRVMGTSYQAEAMALTGNLHKADELLQETVEYVHAMSLQEGAVFSKANLGLGSLYYEWNRLDEALHYLTEGIRLAEHGGYLDQLLPGCAVLVRIQCMQGDQAGLQRTIQTARKLAGKYGDPPAAISYINAIEADLSQQRGALLIADNWLVSRKNSPPDAATQFSQYELATLARVLGAKGDYASMNVVIRPSWELALRQGRVKDAISWEVLLSRCLFMNGEPLPAMAILQGALTKAEPDHFVRTFLDEGGVIVSMIKQLLASRGERKPNPAECSTEYLYFLLEEVGKDTLKASSNRPTVHNAAGSEPLTNQELHILRLLEAGYPNKQIAQELNISLNTVKYHLKNIFGKLGVVNRTQAARMIKKEEQ